MYLRELHVEDFRNLERERLVFDRHLNVFVGDNGQGKTNLLEAVHLAAALRPLRRMEKSAELIRFGAARAHVQGSFDLDGPLDVDVVCEPRGRRCLLANKAVRDVSELARRIGVVAFVPEDIAFVRGSPEARRRAIDGFAFARDVGFASVARRFEAALAQRNALLKQRGDERQLQAFDEPYATAAAQLMQARARAIAVLAPMVTQQAQALTDGALEVTLGYAPHVLSDKHSEQDVAEDTAPVQDAAAEVLACDVDALAKRVLTRCQQRRVVDTVRQTSTIGPHRDDFDIFFNHNRARFLASQGQARALVLAIKLASVRVLCLARDAAPLVLLDDVGGELDPTRMRLLFDTLADVGAQTFVTATHAALLPMRSPHTLWSLQAGRVVDTMLVTP